MEASLHSYLKENARHGDADFPVGFYPCRIPGDYVNLLTHWHEEMEITRVESGSLIYTVGSLTQTVSEGDLILVTPNLLHSAARIEGKTAETVSVVFDLALLGEGDRSWERYLAPIQRGDVAIPAVIRPGDPFYSEMASCMQRLWSCRTPEAPYRELCIKSELLRFMLLACQCSARAEAANEERPEASPYERKMRVVLGYIQEHYSENVTVARLAELCGFSQVHFMNVFKRTMGFTCMEYIIDYRLTSAAVQLRESRDTVVQVAMNNGFPNSSYFNRMFKRKFGVTPREYRSGLRTLG